MSAACDPAKPEEEQCDTLRGYRDDIIFVTNTAYGPAGPLSGHVGFDGVAQAMSGLMDMTGQPDGPPTMIGSFVCDYTTGMYATMGILAALHQCHVTGKGQMVDVSMFETLVGMLLGEVNRAQRPISPCAKPKNWRNIHPWPPVRTKQRNRSAWLASELANSVSFTPTRLRLG